MVLVKHNLETHQFNSLDEAMAFAKELGEFVTIQFDGKEVVGVFGATGGYGWKVPRWNGLFLEEAPKVIGSN